MYFVFSEDTIKSTFALLRHLCAPEALIRSVNGNSVRLHFRYNLSQERPAFCGVCGAESEYHACNVFAGRGLLGDTHRKRVRCFFFRRCRVHAYADDAAGEGWKPIMRQIIFIKFATRLSAFFERSVKPKQLHRARALRRMALCVCHFLRCPGVLLPGLGEFIRSDRHRFGNIRPFTASCSKQRVQYHVLRGVSKVM